MQKSDFTIKIGGVSVETIPLFVQLAADTQAVHKDIDELFATDERRFSLAVSKSAYIDNPLLSCGSIDYEIYAKKFLGLITAAIEEGQGSLLFEQVVFILAKRWDKLYCFIKDHEELDLCEFIKEEYQPCKKNKLWRENLLNHMAAHYFQFFLSFYPIADREFRASLKFSLFMTCALGRKIKISDENFLNTLKALNGSVDKEAKKLRNQFKSSKCIKTAKILKNEIYQQICKSSFLPWEYEAYLEGWAYCSSYLSVKEEVSLLQPEFVMGATERDIEFLCRLFLIKKAADVRGARSEPTAQELPFECTQFVLIGLMLMGVIREYKKMKKLYLANHSSLSRGKMNDLEKKLADCEEELRKANAELAIKRQLLADKEKEKNAILKSHKLSMDELIKENRELKRKASQLRWLPQSKVEFVPRLIPELPRNEDSNLKNTDADLEKLQDVRAVVIGGTETWQMKLKKSLPHFSYIFGDAEGFAEELVVNADIIFADVRFKFSHGCYYKLMNTIRRRNKRIVFLSKTNIALTVHQMADAVASFAKERVI